MGLTPLYATDDRLALRAPIEAFRLKKWLTFAWSGVRLPREPWAGVRHCWFASVSGSIFADSSILPRGPNVAIFWIAVLHNPARHCREFTDF